MKDYGRRCGRTCLDRTGSCFPLKVLAPTGWAISHPAGIAECAVSFWPYRVVFGAPPKKISKSGIRLKHFKTVDKWWSMTFPYFLPPKKGYL
jgi:hypothetical protein